MSADLWTRGESLQVHPHQGEGQASEPRRSSFCTLSSFFKNFFLLHCIACLCWSVTTQIPCRLTLVMERKFLFTVFTHTHAGTHAGTHACRNTCTHVRVCARTRVYMHVRAHACIRMHTRAHAPTPTHIPATTTKKPHTHTITTKTNKKQHPASTGNA